MVTSYVGNIRVEMPIVGDKVISECKTVGDLKKKYPTLHFVKYIYKDPIDNKLKADNPPDDLPIVRNAYITVVGDLDTIIEFSKYITDSG